MDAEYAIDTMVDRIVKTHYPKQIILFGSRARGDEQFDSDVDLLVVFSECDDKRKMALSIMQSLSDLPIGKDIVVTTEEEIDTMGRLVSSLLYPALKEGRLLYAG